MLLKPVKVRSITIGSSEGCDGIWFDNVELNKLFSLSFYR